MFQYLSFVDCWETEMSGVMMMMTMRVRGGSGGGGGGERRQDTDKERSTKDDQGELMLMKLNWMSTESFIKMSPHLPATAQHQHRHRRRARLRLVFVHGLACRPPPGAANFVDACQVKCQHRARHIGVCYISLDAN